MPINSLNLTGPFVNPGNALQNIPNGGLVLYVYQDSSGNGITSLDRIPSGIGDSQNLTVAAALGKCRANRGDTIVVLPNHVETIGANAWPTVAGVTVVGMGNGDERPTFNWNASGSQISIPSANFRISNVIMNLASTASTSTTKAITIAGASSTIDNCRIIPGAAGGAQVATIAIEYTTGADKAQLLYNEALAPTDAAVVSFIKLTNAIDRMRLVGNMFDIGMSSTTVGLVTMTTAPTNIRIYENSFRNGIASSTKALVGVASATGYVEYNQFYITAATGGAAAAGTLGSLQLAQNFGAAGGAVTGVLVGTASS